MNFAITIGMLIYTNLNFSFKTPDTFGNCQKPDSPFGLPQHMHKIENLWKFGLNWSSKFQKNSERKKTLLSKFVCFQMPDVRKA